MNQEMDGRRASDGNAHRVHDLSMVHLGPDTADLDVSPGPRPVGRGTGDMPRERRLR